MIKHCSFYDCGPPRLRSRSVSWNRSGHQLAIASSCTAIRLNVVDAAAAAPFCGISTTTAGTSTNNTSNGSSSSTKEIGSLTGHTGPVTIARFHPIEDSTLISAATDGTVRLWDVRGDHNQRSSMAKLGEQTGVLSLEWSPVQADLFLIAKRTGEIDIYDRRKLVACNIGQSTLAAVHHHVAKDENGLRIPDAALFEPTKGDTVYYGSTSGGEGTADIRLWKFAQSGSATSGKESHQELGNYTQSYLAHAGPIYTMAFSKDGRRLVTGGADAIVGIWNVLGPTDATAMCCTRTIANHTKFIRSVAVSSDNHCLAVATEEGAIDVVALSSPRDIAGTRSTTNTLVAHPEIVGKVPLGDISACAGAEAIAFHPTAKYTLACARVNENSNPSRSPVTIVRYETQY